MKTLRNTLAALWMVAFVLVIWIVAFVFLASSLAHGQAPADPEGAANWKAVQAVGAPASPGGEAVKNRPITKFQFVQIFSRMPQAAQFVPENAQELSDEAFYGEVISRLVARGVKTLEGSKPDELLTRMQFVHITYLLAGGKPGPGYFEQKHFLKQRGIIQPNDIGIYKSLQGDVRVRPAGARDAIRITEPVLFPVLFKDLDKTALDSLVELEFDDLSVLTIGEETVLEINEMVYNPETQERSVVMKLTLGGLRVLASKVEGKSRFQVVTPTAVIGVRGTDFIIVVDGQGRTRVIVLDGLVGVGATAGGTEVVVAANQAVVVNPDGTITPLTSITPQERAEAIQALTATSPVVVAEGGFISLPELLAALQDPAFAEAFVEAFIEVAVTPTSDARGGPTELFDRCIEDPELCPAPAVVPAAEEPPAEEPPACDPDDQVCLLGENPIDGDDLEDPCEGRGNIFACRDLTADLINAQVADLGEPANVDAELAAALADTDASDSVPFFPGRLSTRLDLENTLDKNPGGETVGDGFYPGNFSGGTWSGYTKNALDPGNTAGRQNPWLDGTANPDGNPDPLGPNPLGIPQPYQALYPKAVIDKIQASGLLAYAVQVEEDVVNRAALERVRALGELNVRASLWGSVNTALVSGGIRERDALLEAEADARAGRVLVDHLGNRVRVQQYVLRPDNKTIQVVSASLRCHECNPGNLGGLTYMDWQTRFVEDIHTDVSPQQIRDLPWSDWLTTLREGGGGGTRVVRNPAVTAVTASLPERFGGKNPNLESMRVEFGNGGGDLLREERIFKSPRQGHGQLFRLNRDADDKPVKDGGPQDGDVQHILTETLTTRRSGGSEKFFTWTDPNDSPSNPRDAGGFPTTASPSLSEYSVVATANPPNPIGFSYVMNDEGTLRTIPVKFYVLGDFDTPTPVGEGLSDFEGQRFNDIWAALGVNLGPTFSRITPPNIGANNLEIRMTGDADTFAAPIDAVYVPWTRMVWGKDGERF